MAAYLPPKQDESPFWGNACVPVVCLAKATMLLGYAHSLFDEDMLFWSYCIGGMFAIIGIATGYETLRSMKNR